MSKEYTHRDSSGMLWRFNGSRPVSALADRVMSEVMNNKPRRNVMANRSATDVAQDIRQLMKRKKVAVISVEYFRKMSKRANIKESFIWEVNDELKKDGLMSIRWGGEIMFMKWRHFSDKYFLTAAQAKKIIRMGYREDGTIVPKIYRRLTLVKKVA